MKKKKYIIILVTIITIFSVIGALMIISTKLDTA